MMRHCICISAAKKNAGPVQPREVNFSVGAVFATLELFELGVAAPLAAETGIPVLSKKMSLCFSLVLHTWTNSETHI